VPTVPRPHNEGVDPADLTEAEQLLSKAFSCGDWVDLGSGMAGPPVIRAQVIAALLLRPAEASPDTTAGLRLRGAAVTGRLDLSASSALWPLVFDGCHFDGAVVCVDSTLRTVCLVNCELPEFNGTRLRLDGLLDLTGSRIAGLIQLPQARVNGQVRLRGIRAGTAGGAVAVSARGLSVNGEADCAGMEAHGLVSFEGTAVTGSLDLSGARISCPGERGLDLNYATVGGTLACPDLVVDGETRASNCRISAELIMRGARLENPGGAALSAGGLEVAGGAFLSQGFSARGECTLIGARLAANLSVKGSVFDNPGGTALSLERASIGMLNAQEVSCRGQMNLAGADVGGDVNLAGAALETGDRERHPALNAERSRIGSTFVLSRVKAIGEVNLRSVRVGERLVLDEAELRDPFGVACRLSRAQVTADLFGVLTADGQVKLTGATVGAKASFRGSSITCDWGAAIQAEGLQARELIVGPDVRAEGGIDLRHATIGVLRDDPASWPDHLYLDGLTYQTLTPPLSAGERLGWLARDPGGHQPQPYEQLAGVYTAIGQPAQARTVLYAKERIQHRGKGRVARGWSLLQDVTVGYGYRPRRALGWLALLLTIGSIVFSVSPPPALQAGGAPHFNGIVYTLDLMLPVVNLGQKYTFNPGGGEQWLSYVLIAAGWTLATTVAAGVARVLRRG
jgi:hypothetical protein